MGDTMKPILFVLGMMLAGCGGSNPVDIFGDPSLFPQLALPGGFTGFGVATANDGILINGVNGASLTSPGEGVVVGEGNGLVTILHTTRLQTQLHNLGTTSIKLGDKVNEASVVGTFGLSGQIRFKIFVDNNPVCPVSYLNSAARTTLGAITCI